MLNPEIIIRLNLVTNQIEIKTGIADIDAVMSMLIDALQGMNREKARKKQGEIVLAKPGIIPGKPT